jgi:RNA processing factor Prp31
MGRVISSKIKEFGFLMPSFQFYFEFNNLKDKDLGLCIMCLDQEISLVDLINIILFVHIMIASVYYYKQLHSYVDSKMQDVAPNSIWLIGEMVNVHFISHARVDNLQYLYN